MVSGLNFLNFSFILQQVQQHVSDTGEWVVVVCPNPQVAGECSRYIAASLPSDANFSGRTALLANKGHISVACAEEDVFLPDGQEFITAFVGWDGKNRGGGMAKWRDRAAKTFRFTT